VVSSTRPSLKIRLLRKNLRDGLGVHPVCAPWRIDPALRGEVSPVIAENLAESNRSGNRLDRPKRSKRLQRPFSLRDMVIRFSSATRMAAPGAPWQMSPEKWEALQHLCFKKSGRDNVAQELGAVSRVVNRAPKHLIDNPAPDDLRLPARQTLRKIRTADPGHGWRHAGDPSLAASQRFLPPMNQARVRHFFGPIGPKKCRTFSD